MDVVSCAVAASASVPSPVPEAGAPAAAVVAAAGAGESTVVASSSLESLLVSLSLPLPLPPEVVVVRADAGMTVLRFPPPEILFHPLIMDALIDMVAALPHYQCQHDREAATRSLSRSCNHDATPAAYDCASTTLVCEWLTAPTHSRCAAIRGSEPHVSQLHRDAVTLPGRAGTSTLAAGPVVVTTNWTVARHHTPTNSCCGLWAGTRTWQRWTDKAGNRHQSVAQSKKPAYWT